VQQGEDDRSERAGTAASATRRRTPATGRECRSPVRPHREAEADRDQADDREQFGKVTAVRDSGWYVAKPNAFA